MTICQHVARWWQRAICIAALALLSLPATSEAQTLRIQARDSASNSPLAYALLDLLDANGRVVQSTMTASNGAAQFRLPNSDLFSVLVRRVGFRAFTLGPLRVASGETTQLDARVPRVPVTLAVMRTREESQCDLSKRAPNDASRLVALWEQLRTGLKLTELAALDRQSAGVPTTVRQYVTRLSSENLAVIRHTVVPAHQMDAIPFTSFGSEDITSLGYVRRSGTVATFVAPNENILLSDPFIRDHCFRLVEGKGVQSGLLGLTFTPAPSRRVPEVAGTLWADSTNGTPRYVEFWFVDNRLPARARGEGRSGGALYFGTLPNGTWTTLGWWLRMPHDVQIASKSENDLQLLEIGALASMLDSTTVSDRLSNLQQSTPAYATFLKRFSTGGADVTFRYGGTNELLKGARVTLLQRIDSAAQPMESETNGAPSSVEASQMMDTTVTADSLGNISVQGLPTGIYEMRFSHPVTTRSGIEPPTVEIVVGSNSVAHARVTTTPPDVLFNRCEKGREHTGIFGEVYQGDGQTAPFGIPMPASITVRWFSPDGKEQQRHGESDNAGRYAVCGLPKGIPLTIETTLVSNSRSPVSRARVHEGLPTELTVTLAEWNMTYVTINVPVVVTN